MEADSPKTLNISAIFLNGIRMPPISGSPFVLIFFSANLKESVETNTKSFSWVYIKTLEISGLISETEEL